LSLLLKKRLLEQEHSGILRSLKREENLIDFCSNDYLGFARSDTLIEQTKKAFVALEKLGSTGSRLLTGNDIFKEELEKKIAHYHHAEAALLFSSGYTANLGLFSSILQRDATVLYDEKLHASARDGICLSRARGYSWRHNDLEHLESLLKKSGDGAYVATEGIYSINGNLTPIQELAYLCKRYEAHLIVDEAHSFGFFPKGIVSAFNLEQDCFARIITFSKALGNIGGAILGSSFLKHYLINFSRPQIYTTALPHYVTLALHCAYQFLESQPELPFKLRALTTHCGITSPIAWIPCQKGSAKGLSLDLKKERFDVRPLFYPTVPMGEEGLRIVLHVFNTKEEINRLKACL
jgi:8-amino-7-oxononanoate synthase